MHKITVNSDGDNCIVVVSGANATLSCSDIDDNIDLLKEADLIIAFSRNYDSGYIVSEDGGLLEALSFCQHDSQRRCEGIAGSGRINGVYRKVRTPYRLPIQL